MVVGKLYLMHLSPPCRAVLLTAKAINIDLEQIQIQPMKGENLTPEFLKMNPQHTIPTYLDQDGSTIGDSHAIMAFLVTKYAKDDTLYPKNPTIRARIDHLLHYDSGTLFATHASIVKPMLIRQATGPSAAQLESANAMYDILNAFLGDGRKWLAGTESFTIADLSLITTMMAVTIIVPLDTKKCAAVHGWMERCKAIPFFGSVNDKSQQEYEYLVKSMLAGNYDFMAAFTK